MNVPPDSEIRPSSLTQRLLVRLGGGLAALIGGIAMAGWLLTMPRLASLGQGLIPMAPSTAILFIAFGAVFLLPGQSRSRLPGLSILAAGGCISLALLALSLSGVFLDIEHLGFHTLGAVDGTPIGHMSPITAGTFLLFSLAVPAILTTRGTRLWQAKAAWWIAILITAVYVMLILAYLFGTPMFYSGGFIPPAATTSLAFLALGTALLALALPVVWPETDSRDLGERFFSHALIVVFLFLAAGIISAGFFYHRKHEKQYLTEIECQLSAIADLKKGELQLWREERLADAALFHHNIAFENLVKSIIEQPGTRQAQRDVTAWLGRLQSKRNYNRVALLDARGRSRLSLPGGSAEPVSPHLRQKALEALHTRRVLFADFYRNEFDHKIYLSILVPLFDSAHAGNALGVLEIRIDPYTYLYPFIQNWPTSSATAETLLVRREGNSVLFLNELKFRRHAALTLGFPLERTEIPAVMAALGREGIVRGSDYRGHAVLAALRGIPDSPWHLVTRMDIDEVYAPLREQLWITVLLVSAMLVSAGTGVGFVWRQQSSRYYRNRYEAELERLKLEERLIRIAANVPGAIFQYQLQPDGSACLPYASSGLEVLYGIQPGQVIRDDAALLDAIHPEDRDRVSASIRESAGSLSAWYSEHRVLHPERGAIWVEGNATPERKPDGSVLLHGFLTDITGRKEKEREIEKKNRELERFTYTVSHDLKSPLVTIKTFLGYLREDLTRPGNPRVQQDMGFMHAAADKMAQLLDELLELTRVGRLDNPPQAVAFRDLAREAVQLDAGRISARGVVVAIADSPVVLWGDRPRLVEIWQNLVENACKFMGNQEHPRVEIGVEERGRETLFFVRDNGIGIDPRFHAKVFGLFEKLEAAGEGTGMGLTLVKRIVELYDGEIRVESAGDGTGATFYFTLPAAIRQQQNNG
ncbi:MAG: ATP-binding protein [Geobacteraceae bacterium]|nr:ATP-binding protein [Geobacteraceae bacterium]